MALTLTCSVFIYFSYFSRRPPKRRRVSVLHPDMNGNSDPFSSDDSAMIAYLLQTSRLDYDALAQDFLRASVVGNMVKKKINNKYIHGDIYRLCANFTFFLSLSLSYINIVRATQSNYAKISRTTVDTYENNSTISFLKPFTYDYAYYTQRFYHQCYYW